MHIIYTVEVSRYIVKLEKPRGRARRGLDKGAILDAAFAMLDAEGEAGFSVRKLATEMGIDPMTVLHHFKSKDELLRRIADKALELVELPKPSGDWQEDLRSVARGYRELAKRHPRLFHLHFRYHSTGPADHASSEVVYQAMREAGLSDERAAGLGLAFYAFVLGFAQSEVEGLMQPVSAEEKAELEALESDRAPATRALIPAFASLNPDAAFRDALEAFIKGLDAL